MNVMMLGRCPDVHELVLKCWSDFGDGTSVSGGFPGVHRCGKAWRALARNELGFYSKRHRGHRG